MLDIRYIRQNPQTVQEKAAQKGYDVDVSSLLALDERRRELQTQTETLRQERNAIADRLKSGGRPADADVARGRELKTQLAALDSQLNEIETAFHAALVKIPNMPLADVPVGSSEDQNVVTKTVGQQPTFSFTPKNHWEIGYGRGWIDKERAAKVAGSRFVYVKDGLARLHWAMMHWAMNELQNPDVIKKIVADNNLQVSDKPFTLVMPPAMIRTEVYEATGRLNAEEVTYKLEADDLWLNASAEHSLCPMYKDEILPAADLPIRYVGYSTSFRREAGTYGKDMEGIVRLHQFEKLEMESFTTADQGVHEHHFMIAVQEYLMQQLELPYRVLTKCTADIGGPNAAGTDVECWLPGQGKYLETHTADYMTDYQTRRLRTRVRTADGELELAHTNDATALTQRPLVGIIENYQNEDGTVRVPAVLQPYLGGLTLI